jgi:tryptophanyl-tRNA synthetase
VTQYGELRRMTQFKDKTGGQDEAVSAALFVYPVLQAADILLYDADLVPVGEDQRQHVELTRDVAIRFNSRYGDTFVVPAPDIKAEGARIMALDDPTKKMSKSSASVGSYISMTDTPDEINRKIKRAVTDSGSDIRATADKPAVANLLTIHSLFSGKTLPELEEHFSGKGYGALKSELADVIVDALAPIQSRFNQLSEDPDQTLALLCEGAARARELAVAKMVEVRERMGLVLTPSTS